MAGRTEYFFVFVNVHLFQFVAGGAQIFARIEFARTFGKNFADGRGHCEASVGVDGDFAHGRFCGFAQLRFGNTDGIF